MLQYKLKKNIVYLFYLNSVDPDEMLHYAAFHLGLHCLQKYPLLGFPYTKGKNKILLFFHQDNA